MNNKENMEWEKEAAYLASLPRTMPYRVPDQYFDDLSVRIHHHVFLASLDQQEKQGFAVPEGYFEELGNQIHAKVATEQLRERVATDGFTTPNHYFEKLQGRILSKTVTTAPKKNIFKLWHQDAVKYVSAACFIVLTASALYLNQQHTLRQNAKSELANEQLLYDIDENTIFEHIEEHQAMKTTTVSDTEMENYILDNFSTSDLSNNL